MYDDITLLAIICQLSYSYNITWFELWKVPHVGQEMLPLYKAPNVTTYGAARSWSNLLMFVCSLLNVSLQNIFLESYIMNIWSFMFYKLNK